MLLVFNLGQKEPGLYVRGGGPDQNLMLLDGVPIQCYSFIWFFLVSMLMQNNVELIKGGFPLDMVVDFPLYWTLL